MKKYISMASRFPDVACMQLYGDESPDTRRMMVTMKVKVTPTFFLYRGGEVVGTVTGVDENKLLRAMVDKFTPEELAAHAEDVAALEAAEKEEEQAQARR